MAAVVGLTDRLRAARRDIMVLMAALGHPGTPRRAKLAALLVVAYAVSPIDLIPDPIPVLGLLDDAILLPLGVLLVRRLIPDDVFAECRDRPASPVPRWLVRTGVAFVVMTWIATVAAVWLVAQHAA